MNFDRSRLEKLLQKAGGVVPRGQVDDRRLVRALRIGGRCAFSHAGYAQYNSAMGFPGITAREVVDWFRLATGMDVTFESLMEAGERIVNLKRIINMKLGMKPGDDTLPRRFLTVVRKSGPVSDPIPPIDKLLSDYYQVRGWNSDGSVGDKKISDLGLEPHLLHPAIKSQDD